MIAAIWLARTINKHSGGTVIAPWQINDLPEDWIDVFVGLERDLPTLQAQQKKIKDRFAKMEAAHPTYRKYS